MQLPKIGPVDLNDYVTVLVAPKSQFDQTEEPWFGIGPVTKDGDLCGVSMSAGRLMVAVHTKE